MSLINNAMSGVLTLLLCIGAGFLSAKTGYIDEATEVRLSRFTLHFSVPCLLFVNCLNYISRELIADLGFILLTPGVIILACYLCAAAVGRLFRVKKENFGLFCVMFSMSNTIFMGLPICLAIFGEAALPLVAAYFPFNTLAFWTLGAVGLAADGGERFRPGAGTLKKIFSPPLIGALAGAAFALTGLKLPAFLSEAFRYMGNITTPVACVLAGCALSRMGKTVFKLGKEGRLTLLGRMLVSPLAAAGLCALFNAPPLVTKVFVLESAMPVMSQSMLLARSYNANHKLAAQMFSLTTVVGLPYMPLLLFALERFT